MLMNYQKGYFLRYFIFAFLFAVFCLTAIYYGYQSYRSNNIAEQVERVSLDLLGYVEYGSGKFYISDEYNTDVDRFVTGWLGSNEGISYIWDVDENQIVWSLDQQLKNGVVYLPKLIQQHANLAYLNNDFWLNKQSGFSPADVVAIRVPVGDVDITRKYMTAAQLMTVKAEEGSRGKPKQYLFVTAKSMQATNDDLAALIRVSIIVLMIFSLLLGLGRLIYWFFTKAKTEKHAEVIQGELS